MADDSDERDAVTFGTGFGGITDIRTGPDGYLYILTFGGSIYRIVPIQASGPTTYPDSYFVDNPLSKAVISTLQFVDLEGADTSQVSAGEEVSISTTFRNQQDKEQPYAYVVQIIDSGGITVSMDFRLGSLAAGGTSTLSLPWSPEGAGEYTVKVLIWSGLEIPIALSEAEMSSINVV